MKATTAYSSRSEINEAVKEIREQIGGDDHSLILFFASSNYNPEKLAGEMHKAFNGCKTMGCTTAGEITSGQLLKNSIVAMGFSEAHTGGLSIQVVEGLDGDLREKIKAALSAQAKHFGVVGTNELDPQEYLGLISVDGLSGKEEAIMDAVGDFTNVRFVGGSAGDDVKFERTHVFYDGRAYTNAAVLALLKPQVPFDIIKTQSFTPGDKVLTVTRADVEKRTVLEFDDRPAAEAYARALDTNAEALSNHFMNNPLGLMIDNEPFIRSPQQVQDDQVIFYCNISPGMKLNVMKSTDIIADTEKAIQTTQQEFGPISAMINFHCILRTLDLDAQGTAADYGKLFKEIPTIGFSTYGEQYIGHINQTSTIVIFGQRD